MSLYPQKLTSISCGCQVIGISVLLFLLAACGGSSTPQARKTPTPLPTPTAGQGQRLLAQVAQNLNTARTLHGQFNLVITGLNFNGTVESEIWNEAPNKNRTETHSSTLAQLPTGSVTVTNGKQLWQYDPIKKVVYTGPIPATTGTPTAGSGLGVSGGQSQFILSIVQAVFTRSDATLASSSTHINGHDAYDIHVVSQGQSTAGGGAGFNYTGEVYLDKASHLPLQVNLTIKGFGQVLLDLPKLVLNQPIPDSVFTFVPPAGVKVLPLQQASATPDTGTITLDEAQQQAGYHLLSIPASQSDYALTGVDALGAPGNQIYTLNYVKGNLSFTIAEGKPLANLPNNNGQQVRVRGLMGTLSTINGSTTLAWTENGVGVRIAGVLSSNQIVSIAKLLS